MKTTKSKTAWPVFITVFYIVFVLFMFVVFFFSQNNRTNLVSENYYEEELRYEDQIRRIRNANDLAVQPTIEYKKENRVLIVAMPDEFKSALKGNIKMFRPSNAQMDTDYDLNLINNKQLIPTDNLSSGLWLIKFSWSHDNKEYYLEKDQYSG